MANRPHTTSLGLLLVVAAGCGGGGGGEPQLQPPVVEWSVSTDWTALEGSPSLCDLDGDGEPELVVPIADSEPLFGYLLVLEAKSGRLRWKTPPGSASFAYPMCADVDGDGLDDVLVSGRIGDVIAFKGTTGARLWSLAEVNGGLDVGNVYAVTASAADAPVFFVSAGGGSPLESVNPPGLVLAIDRQGVIVGRWDDPAGTPLFSSPAVAALGEGRTLVAVGTGREVSGGALELLLHDAATGGFTALARVESACQVGGYIASPVIGDLGGDGLLDVVAIDFCGAVVAVASDGGVRWRRDGFLPFGSANPLLADLTGDGELDVLVAFESLNWTDEESTSHDPRSLVLAFDGFDGATLWQRTLPGLVFASPVSTLIDGDEIEDAVVIAAAHGDVEGGTYLLSGVDGELIAGLEGSTYGTPVLADLEQDGVAEMLLARPVFDGSDYGRVECLALPTTRFAPERSFSGFRGQPIHDGRRHGGE